MATTELKKGDKGSAPSRRADSTPGSKSRLTPIKIYLLAYNVVSCLLWLNLLVLTVSSMFHPSSSAPLSPTFLSRLLSYSANKPSSALPALASKALDHLRGGYDHANLGWWTKYTQSLAVLEVVHSAVGWVRSPVPTVLAQVFSRLYAVWGVVEAVPSTHENPLFTTMLFAWSVTEVIRYAFYALSILGIDVYALNWLRYNTFIPLYPLGAGSEAFLAFSTLPPFSNLPFLPTSLASLSPLSWILTHMPTSIRDVLVKTTLGRGVLWRMAQAGVKAKVATSNKAQWTVIDFARLFLFVLWWPALYVLFSHMLVQRRKFFGKGKTVGGANKKL